MSLKNIFSSIKDESYIVGKLDKYLESLPSKDSDRAIDVNAPSQAGTCLRSRYYMRKGYETDGSINARTRRIFDNGTFTHERLQGYLKKQGMLICDELPIHNTEYNIQGHTDGLLKISSAERAILEIKSINSRSFGELKTAKPEHKMQGLIYLYCVEQRRLELHNKYKDLEEFNVDSRNRLKFYKSLYQHLKDGSHYSRADKIAFQCDLHEILDEALMQTDKPITKAVFLYENKDTQDLKEFCIQSGRHEEDVILRKVLEGYSTLNSFCERNEVPPREGTSKSCETCRWCNFKVECWL